MAINAPNISQNYYAESIERWSPNTSESRKVRDLSNDIKLIKIETQFIQDNGYKPTVGIDFTKRLDTF